MSDPGKKPGVAFWVVVTLVALLVLLVAYPISIGPAAWIANQTGHKGPLYEALVWFYAPVEGFLEDAPEPIQDALDWWIDLWV